MIERFEEFTRQVALAYKYVIKIKAQEMSAYGLKASNVTCLFFLGKHTEGLTATELCEKCMEDKAGVSKSLAVLKEMGYVTQEDEKKYKSKYFITASGKAVFDEVRVVIESVVEKVGEGLSEEEREVFYTALEKIIHNLEVLTEENK